MLYEEHAINQYFAHYRTYTTTDGGLHAAKMLVIGEYCDEVLYDPNSTRAQIMFSSDDPLVV